VVSVAHGTVGSARICAPSLAPFDERMTQAFFFELMVEPFTSAGYAVTATDYVGMGTPGVSPYLVGEDAGRNVLDAARMIRRLPLPALADVTVIWGHSQGGQAAAFAGQIATGYAPDLRIVGIVAGAPAAELGMLADEVARVTKPSPLTGLMVMIARAWSAAYPDVEPDSILTGAALKKIDVVDRDCVAGALLAYLLRPAPDYLIAGGLKASPWSALLAANTPGVSATQTPVLIFQGGADPLIRPSFTEAFVQRLCAVGDTVSLNLYPGKGHLSVIAPSMPDTLAWIAARLQQQPPPSSC
jgi:acetyl esterase/lipase